MRALMLAVMLSTLAASAEPVASLREGVALADARKRGPLATGLKPALIALGKEALPQMLAELERPTDPAWTETAALAWKASLLDALGTFQDARSRPVFQRVLADETGHFLVQRAAAEGLAKLGDADALIGQIGRDAVVAGIGSARRHAVARALALELAKQPAEPRAKLIVKALGEVGNSWAWATLPVREEELATRNEAAKSLVTAFVKYGGEVRQAAATQLLVVDAPNTAALLAQEKARGFTGTELEALLKRVGSKPPLR